MLPEPSWIAVGDTENKICLGCGHYNFCKCSWCSRCGQLTFLSYGHWTGFCKVSKTKTDLSSTVGQTHFCCPDNCELEEDKNA